MNRYLFIIFLQLLPMSLMAQGWVAPEDKKGKLSPFAFSEETRKAGEKLYAINCKSCHGIPGKGNFLNLVPPPGDPATDKIQHNSDGEIFYKVTTGRGPMPSFKNAVSSNDIWNIISFLRSFNAKYVQSVMPVIKSAEYPGAVINMSLFMGKGNDTVIMKVIAISEKSVVPVKNASVKLFVKRNFGFLPLDEDKNTDLNGFAYFRVPKELPGDTAGNVILSGRFVDEDLFGTATKDTVLNAGIITIPVSLVKERAMWNTVRKAPVWILLTYSLGLLAVWGFIFYVLLKLRDIFVIGEHINKISRAGKKEKLKE